MNVEPEPPSHPRARHRLAAIGLRLIGWRPRGACPRHRKAVLVVAPHTSNWDFPVFLLMVWWFDLEIRWLAKKSLFVPGVGWLLRKLGGIPVDRSSAHGLVEELAARFAATDSLIIAVPAEGTRGYRDHWKSGFYNIARRAGVPIYPGYLDAPSRSGGIGEPIVPSGELESDMDRLREFYADKRGVHPKLAGRVRLREETSEGTAPGAEKPESKS